VDDAIIAGNYIDVNDMCLVRICSSVDAAVEEIEHFFSNYESFEVVASGRTSRSSARHRPLNSLN